MELLYTKEEYIDPLSRNQLDVINNNKKKEIVYDKFRFHNHKMDENQKHVKDRGYESHGLFNCVEKIIETKSNDQKLCDNNND